MNTPSSIAEQLADAMERNSRAWCRDPLLGDLVVAYVARKTDPDTWRSIHEVLVKHNVVRDATAAIKSRVPNERESQPPRGDSPSPEDPGWPVRRIGHDPPEYEIEVMDGVVVRLRVAELMSQHKFTERYIEVTGTPPPSVDKKRWREFYENLLQRAEFVELPEEAGRRGALLDTIENLLADLPVGEDADDLRAGRSIQIDGFRYVRLAMVANLLREHGQTPEMTTLATALHELGWKPKSVGPEKKRIRAWRRKIDEAPPCDT